VRTKEYPIYGEIQAQENSIKKRKSAMILAANMKIYKKSLAHGGNTQGIAGLNSKYAGNPLAEEEIRQESLV
jgi:hypothetical protein